MNAYRFPAALAALTLALPLCAQTSLGRLNGQISDASTAVVNGAAVEVRSTTTGLLRTTGSDATGAYRVEALEPGAYDVSVKMAGFTTFVKRNVPMQAGTASRLDVVLEVGAAATVVEVTAGSEVLLQAESVTRGGSITSLEAQEFAIAGRNAVAFALTLPGFPPTVSASVSAPSRLTAAAGARTTSWSTAPTTTTRVSRARPCNCATPMPSPKWPCRRPISMPSSGAPAAPRSTP
ncbi:MAG: hypothetical protein FJW38_09520 [Acidobacteria bacterium]|nr:hypothetical protein [Acidobacteriota bacterium]